MRSYFAALTLALALANAAPAQPRAITHVTVITGTGAPPTPNQTILIEAGRITAVFNTGSQPIPTNTHVIELKGHYVIPGLIDAHVHVATDPAGRDANALTQLERALRGGVTSVRDMAGDAIALRTLADSSNAPTAPRSRVYFAALMAGPSFFTDPRTKSSAHGGIPGELAWLQSVDSTTDVRAAVAAAKQTGATGIKLYADLNRADIKRITSEAHAQGMRVWSHSTAFPATPLDAVDAGVDVLSHAAILYWAGANDVPNRYAARAVRAAYDSVDVDGPVMRDLFARMRAAGTVLDATLFVAARLETAPPGTSGFADPRRAIQWMYDATRAAHRAGVTVAAGTDGMLPGGDTEPPNIHREMELLVTRAGFTPLDAITAATRGSARALGALDSLGTIEKGKLADLVVLSADPTMDIRNSRRITLVLKGGEVHSPLTPPARR